MSSFLWNFQGSDTYWDRVFTRSRSLLSSSRLWFIRESETRTERVYYNVNRDPVISTSGGRQDAFAIYIENNRKHISKTYQNETGYISINTLEGTEKLYPTEILIKGVEGEYYPVKRINFDKVYEVIE